MAESTNMAWWTSLDAFWKRLFKIILDPELHWSREKRDVFEPDEEQLALLLSRDFLDIENTSVSNLAPLKVFTKLQFLRLSALNDLKDLDSLPDLPALQELTISYTRVADISPISRLTALQTLRVSQNGLTSMAGIVNLGQLKFLWLEEPGVTNLDFLSKLQNLTFLRLSKMNPADLSHVGALASLRELRITATTVSDLSFLRQLGQLRTILFERNGLTSLESLPVLDSLTELQCVENQLTDLAPLAMLKHLQVLNLVGCPITSLDALVPNNRLKRVIVSDADYDKEMVKRFRQAHPGCSLETEHGPEFPFKKFEIYEAIADVVAKRDDIKAGAVLKFESYTFNHYDGFHIYFLRDVATMEQYRIEVNTYDATDLRKFFREVTA